MAACKVDDGVEAAATDALAGESGEERLYRIQPGAGCWSEVEGPARMARQPSLHLGMLVCGVVVDDGLDHLAGGHVALDGVEEADELGVPMTLHAAADHGASSTLSAANSVVVPWRL